MIELGHNLGIEVVAEGVENQATLEILAGLGCDWVQGFYMGAPIGAADATRWLQARAHTRRPERWGSVPASELIEDGEGLHQTPSVP